tara:strand:+ start:74 stop:601 length:528 start_codon:yes stop_codon:yes gene_type:complete
MEEYTKDEFLAQYGELQLSFWDKVTNVTVENSVATLYKDENEVGTIPFTLHEGVYVKHGFCTDIVGGKFRFECHTMFGKVHCEGEPATRIWTLVNEKLISEFWMINGKYHNENGPAVITYCPITGNKIVEDWYLHGVKTAPFDPAEYHAAEHAEHPEDDVLEVPDRWEGADPEWD